MKLKLYGIQGIAGQWFKSYLNHGKWKVEIKSAHTRQNTYSEWGTVNHRGLKGRVLGPYFSSHIHDMPATINSQSKPILFAVDMSIIIVHSELFPFWLETTRHRNNTES
jgi:hypothetical protein